MTLIAAYLEGDIPVLLGDLLLSGRVRPAAPLTLPTHDDAREAVTDDGFPQPWGTARKIVRLRENVAIGWANVRMKANIALNDLDAKLSDRPTIDEVRNVLAAIDRDASSENSFLLVGWVLADEPTTFRWSSEDPAAITTGKRAFAGSGGAEWSFDEAMKGSEPLGYGGMQAVVGRLALMLGLELFDAEHFQLRFGGGFDALVAVDGRFVPLPSVTVCFMRTHAMAPGAVVEPYGRVLKYGTLDDDIYYFVASGKSQPACHWTTSVLRPSHGPPREFPLTMASDYVAVVARTKTHVPDRSVSTTTVLVEPAGSARLLALQIREGGTGIAQSKRLYEALRVFGETLVEEALKAPSQDIFDRLAPSALKPVGMEVLAQTLGYIEPFQHFDLQHGVHFAVALRGVSSVPLTLDRLASCDGMPNIALRLLSNTELEFSVIDGTRKAFALRFAVQLSERAWTAVMMSIEKPGKWQLVARVEGREVARVSIDLKLPKDVWVSGMCRRTAIELGAPEWLGTAMRAEEVWAWWQEECRPKLDAGP